MCYFLYGAINDGINAEDYKIATKNSMYHFNVGKNNDVNLSVKNNDALYRITSKHCDCDSPFGEKKTNKKELEDLQVLFLNLKSVRGIKHIYISKNWSGEVNEKEETFHIDNIDIMTFLANAEENCLYKIELYPKYY